MDAPSSSGGQGDYGGNGGQEEHEPSIDGSGRLDDAATSHASLSSPTHWYREAENSG